MLSLYSRFLAVIQISNKNQPRKTGSHPLLLLPAHLPGFWGTGLGWEAGSTFRAHPLLSGDLAPPQGALWPVNVHGSGRWRCQCGVPRGDDLVGPCCCPHFPIELSLGQRTDMSVSPRAQSQGNLRRWTLAWSHPAVHLHGGLLCTG